MANDTDDAASGRTVSPTVGVKREHSDDEEDLPRRVSQRTEAGINNEGEEPPSMKQLVLKDLQSDDEAEIVKAMKHIWEKMNKEHNPHAAEDAKEFYQLGGHAFVFAGVMTKQPNDEAIQHHCIRLIARATYRNEDLCIAFALVDGMQAVLAAVDKFPNSRLIQHNGIVALLNMTWDNDANATTLVKDLNGIPTILGAMGRFSNDEDVARVGCKALRWLCRLEELRQPIFDANAFSALAKARDTFKDNTVVKRSVAGATEHFLAYC